MRECPSAIPGTGVWYGQQWMTWTASDGAGAPVAFGHGGSDGTHYWAWPGQDLIVLFFTQSRGTVAGLKLEGLLHRLLVEGDLSETEPALQLSSADLEPYLGLYQDEQLDHGFAAVTRRDDRLVVELPGLALLVFTPTSAPDAFVSEATDRLRVTFHRDGAGRVSALTWHEGEHSSRHERLAPDAGLPSAEEVVARMMRAHGTRRLHRAGGVRMAGQLTLEARGLSGSISLLFSTEGARTDTEVGGQRQTSWITRERGWSENAMTGRREMDGPQLAQALLDQPAQRWGDWLATHGEVRVVGREVIDERPVWIVWTRSGDAPGSVRHVDALNGRLVRSDGVMVLPGMGPVGVKVRYGDFRDVGRLVLPFRIDVEAATPLVGRIVTQFEAAQTRVAVPERAFEPPAPDS
jgi:hypothetical protein